MSDFKGRLIRPAKLDVHLFEEVEADTGAIGQAMLVVILSSVAAGIGTCRYAGLNGILAGTIGSLIGWFIWAYLTSFIGTRLLPEQQTHATPGELLRTVGFSSSPGIIRVLGIIPGLTEIVSFGAAIWMLIAMVIAVIQALDYKSTWRAVGVCIIGLAGGELADPPERGSRHAGLAHLHGRETAPEGRYRLVVGRGPGAWQIGGAARGCGQQQHQDCGELVTRSSQLA